MIAKTLSLLTEKDQVCELRILNTNKGTISGYFNNYKVLESNAMDYNDKVPGIYITLNPVKKDLLARANNRVNPWARQTTSDADIEYRKWLPIDFDPVRPSGISSTEEEQENARKLAEEVMGYLKKLGWSEPILANSGNGFHLLYSINLPNDDTSRELVKGVLEVLDFKFTNEKVSVDTSTFNAARIWKLYGTKSCKGDHTDERPHRTSEIISSPETIKKVSKGQLKQLADEMKSIKKPQNTINHSKSNTSSFDIDEWIEKYGLVVVNKGDWQGGIRYVLATCPWKDEHTDRSAYIIQFSNGAISAGCHHDSCSEENWQSLRKKFEPNYEPSKVASIEEKETQSDILIRLGSEAKYFTNEIEEAFAEIEINGHTELWKIKSRTYKMWLTKRYYDETGKAPTTDAMNQAIGVMEAKAMFEGKERTLHLRVAKKDEKYYYDLANETWEVVEVTPNGCEVLKNPPILFTRNNNMDEQIKPNFDGDIKLLLNHVRFKSEEDRLLYLVYVVSCFVPDIPHIVLVYSGEKGASKSTSMRMTRQVVDPAFRDLQTMPNGIQDLAISLANNYMPCYDNLDSLSAEKSDLLCIASTGGSFSKRTLYTDDEETFLELKRCPALNGINVVVTRSDLMDRSIVLELDRIPEEERKEESVVWSEFNKDKPSIVGGALQTLSKAMAIYPTVQLDKLSRMADFTRWGYAIAEAMGYKGEQFLEAYKNNQNQSNEEAIYNHPVAACVVALMRNRSKWVGSVAQLLTALEGMAIVEKININMKSFPKAAHILSRRLKEVKSNLEEKGITYSIRHAGDAKEVTITNSLITKNGQEGKVVSMYDERLQLRVPKADEVELTEDYDEFADL